ncbi:hypothetical protein BVX95_01475 [archaeon D22]|nr:hypothetical protein BVX95_01475 [archaeon D22]
MIDYVKSRIKVSQKRKLVNFGIFSIRHWPFFRPDKGVDKEIYNALIGAGFRGTVWQFIYKGQLAGVILPLFNGTQEVHIRFYKDTIEAELEVGRHFLDHFLQPRFQAESYVLSLLRDRLGADAYQRATCLFRVDPSSPEVKRFQVEPKVSFIGITNALIVVIAVMAILGVLPQASIFVSLILAIFVYKTLPEKSQQYK